MYHPESGHVGTGAGSLTCLSLLNSFKEPENPAYHTLALSEVARDTVTMSV